MSNIRPRHVALTLLSILPMIAGVSAKPIIVPAITGIKATPPSVSPPIIPGTPISAGSPGSSSLAPHSVPPAGSAGAVLVVTSPLQLSATTVAGGDSVTGQATLQNQGADTITVSDIVITGRPPGGTNLSGPYLNFGGTGSVTLGPGQSIAVEKTRTFADSDPTGNWYSYVTYQTTDALWHDDPRDVYFTVTSSPTTAADPAVPASPADEERLPSDTSTSTPTPVPPSATATQAPLPDSDTSTGTPTPATSTSSDSPIPSTSVAPNTAVPCPVGWSCADIGNPPLAGSQSLSNGVWTISGEGTDIGGTADQFHFVWQPLAADGGISAQVLTQTSTNSRAKAGVMLRPSTDPSAPFYAALVTPQRGIFVLDRAAQGAGVSTVVSIAGAVPAYLQVQRAGTTFTAYTSSDGTSWMPIAGSGVTLNITGTVLAGMAVTSHTSATPTLSTATFSNVTINTAAPPPSTATSTPVPPTDTATNTPVLPTSTATATSTPTPTMTATNTPLPSTSTATNTPAPSPASCAQQTSPYMQAGGTAFCFGGQSVQLYGSTMYPYWSYNGKIYRGSGWELPAFTQYIDSVLNLAQAAHLNTIRPTDYLANAASWDDPVVWANMDYLVQQAQARHMWVILDISTFRQWLTNHGVQFVYDASDWMPFLQFVAQRYLTATAVCQYSIAGEIPPQSNGGATPSQYIQFFTAVEDQLYADDGGHHLLSVGGLSFLNSPSYGLPWQTLYGLPHNGVVAIHVYSSGDRDVTVPTVSSWAQANQKPFIVEEFGFQQSLGDQARAAAYADMYSWCRSYHAVGMVFWNLGTELAATSYEVSPQTPLTWAVVQGNAPS